jgi:branched-chain amino acid transport system ATP-binding protein
VNGLQLNSVTIAREGTNIVRDLSMSVPRGEVTVLLGPNGAGKTTLLEAISGLIQAAGGTIELDGNEIRGVSRVRRARMGLGHVEQGRAIFGELTVLENVAVAAADNTAGADALRLFPELEPRNKTLASLLSGGEQQMLVIARALAARPTLLLIDEMSLGLAPVIVRRLMPRIRTLADEGIGVLLVEQFAALALTIGDSGYVLSRGEIRHHGPCSELADQMDVLQGAYLGAADAPTAPSSNGHAPHGVVSSPDPGA